VCVCAPRYRDYRLNSTTIKPMVNRHFLFAFPSFILCYVGLFHHGIAGSWIADGGDGLPIYRVTANILNKQSRTAEKGWSYSLVVGRELRSSHRRTTLLRNVTQGLGIGRLL
jgi:hypothetical protein